MHSYYVAIDILTSHLGLSVDEAIESINLPPEIMNQLKKSYRHHSAELEKQNNELQY